MTEKEKAMAYDEAIERAKYYYNEGKTLEYANDIVSDIFPELKESDDERIRKTLIEMFSNIGKKDWRDIPTEKSLLGLKSKVNRNLTPMKIFYKDLVFTHIKMNQIYYICQAFM